MRERERGKSIHVSGYIVILLKQIDFFFNCVPENGSNTNANVSGITSVP